MQIEYFQLIDRIIDLNLGEKTITVEAQVPEKSTIMSISSLDFIFFMAARASFFVATTTSCSTTPSPAFTRACLERFTMASSMNGTPMGSLSPSL